MIDSAENIDDLEIQIQRTQFESARVIKHKKNDSLRQIGDAGLLSIEFERIDIEGGRELSRAIWHLVRDQFAWAMRSASERFYDTVLATWNMYWISAYLDRIHQVYSNFMGKFSPQELQTLYEFFQYSDITINIEGVKVSIFTTKELRQNTQIRSVCSLLQRLVNKWAIQKTGDVYHLADPIFFIWGRDFYMNRKSRKSLKTMPENTDWHASVLSWKLKWPVMDRFLWSTGPQTQTLLSLRERLWQ